jgi:WD40 repeat protein
LIQQTAAQGKVLIVQTPLGVYLYDAQSLALRGFLEGARQYLLSIDGEWVALRYPGGVIRVLKVDDGEESRNLAYEVKIPWYWQDYLDALPAESVAAVRASVLEELSRMTSAALSADNQRLAVGFGDDHVRIWNLADEALVQDMQHDLVKSPVQMAFSPDNGQLVTVEAEGDISAWRLEEARLLWHQPRAGHIVGQPFSPDGTLLATEVRSRYSQDSWVILRNTAYGDELGQVVGQVASDPFSADSKNLATTWYQRVRVYSTSSLSLVQKFETGLDWPSATYSRDGAYILVNGGIQAWRSGDFTLDNAASMKAVVLAAVVDETRRLLELGHYVGLQGVAPLSDRELLIWGIENAMVYWKDIFGSMSILENGASLLTPILSSDGAYLFYCGPQKMLFKLQIIDLTSHQLGNCNASTVLAYSNGFLARGRGTTLDILDVSNGEIVHSLLGHLKRLSTLAFSPDGSLLASGSEDFAGRGFGEIGAWAMDPASMLFLDNKQPWGVEQAAFSKDNQWLALYGNGKIQIWNIPERRLYQSVNADGSRMAFSPDGGLLAAADREGAIQLVKIPGGDVLTVLSGHASMVTGLAFTTDGGTLLSVSEDGTLRLWSAP